MKNTDIATQRLRHQSLTGAKYDTANQVVSALAAVQAQDYAGAKWALGLRMQRATDDDIEQAFTSGAILRTHLLRPTWHFVTPADIRWLLALTAPRVHAANAYMYQRSGLDSAVLKRSRAILEKTLRGGQQLTRDELRDAYRRAGLSPEVDLRVTYLLMHAELEGLICSGARRGKQFTYALLEERVPPAKALDREEALAELSRRYYLTRGPATAHDFAKWSGLTVSDARRGIAAIHPHLSEVQIDGQTYWLSNSAPAPTPRAPARTAHLLSIYDEYISSYKDRSMLGDPDRAQQLMSMGNDLTAILLLNGRIAGTWKRSLAKDQVLVRLSPFVAPTAAETRVIAAEAQRYGDFLNRALALEYVVDSKSKRQG